MGQKTNPLCFRLGTTHSHHSVWFEEPKKNILRVYKKIKKYEIFSRIIYNMKSRNISKLLPKN
jgi:hypothetical protein